jgi:hypothetical protein
VVLPLYNTVLNTLDSKGYSWNMSVNKNVQNVVLQILMLVLMLLLIKSVDTS